MIYSNAQDWRDSPNKRVLFFGMSGLGKTHLSKMLRASGDWFHYSVDYRIGTRYMGEHIADNAKSEAMKNPFLKELLMSGSISIRSNISFDNLAPVSTYLGKPGDVAKGGLPMAAYEVRQQQFKEGEIAALYDTAHFIRRAQRIYDYPHFICDTGGSICEWVDPDAGAEDPLIKALAADCLLVWIKGDAAHSQELIRRFDKAPKPMAYQPEFLADAWSEYLIINNANESDVNPNDFIRWTYGRALAHRQPLYQAMAEHGVTITAEDVAQVSDPAEFDALIAQALEQS